MQDPNFVNDLNDLLSGYGTKAPPAAVEPSVEPVAAEPTTEPIAAKTTEPVVAEPKAADPAVSEPDILAVLNQLGAAAQQPFQQAAAAPTAATIDNKPAEQKAAEWLLKDDDAFTRILSNRDAFNAHLQTVYNDAVKVALEQAAPQIQRANEESLRKVGETVPNQIQHYVTLNNMVRDFYKDNPELVPIRQQVGYLANAISTAHPEYNYEQIFAEASKQGKYLLSLAGQKAPNGAGAKPAPAFAKPVAARRAEPAALSGLQKEINELIM